MDKLVSRKTVKGFLVMKGDQAWGPLDVPEIAYGWRSPEGLRPIETNDASRPIWWYVPLGRNYERDLRGARLVPVIQTTTTEILIG